MRFKVKIHWRQIHNRTLTMRSAQAGPEWKARYSDFVTSSHLFRDKDSNTVTPYLCLTTKCLTVN